MNFLKQTIADVMTADVISVQETDGLKKLFKLMDDHAILGLPVVNGEGKLTGIVTESDLIKNVTTLKSPFAITLLGSIVYLDSLHDFNQSLKEHCAKEAKDVMTHEVITVQKESTLAEAIDLMSVHRISRLPVVNKDGALVGIVTRSDIVHQLAKLKSI